MFTRRMMKGDLARAAEIEGLTRFPWGIDETRKCLRQRRGVAIVVSEDEFIVGWAMMEGDMDDKHITRFIIHPDFVRSEAPQLLLEALMCCSNEGDSFEVAIDVMDLDMQIFFGNAGFRIHRDIPDAYIMRHGMRFCKAPDLKYRMPNATRRSD